MPLKDGFNSTTGEWQYIETSAIDGQGLTNEYREGFVKVVPMNLSDANYFADIFQKEVIDKKWLLMDSTLAIMVEFYLYNPNLRQAAEKRVIVEFLETGGFINFEHDVMLINMMLTRDAQ